ncbi:GNAT family N-acetyltransferase [Algirhabdus cladophorae]|uniref:GNAT family N-acetyltransferase n=1 Tax=Algirhabdus cladophorae TaxID=3377108 RepID=UPI003B849C23
MDIRKVEATDAQAIADIHRRARATAMPWLPVMHSAAGDLQYFQTKVLPTETVHVACAPQIIGFIAAHDGWVNHLYLDPACLRQGIGTLLLDLVKADAESLQLWTFQKNVGARAFYQAQGFAEVEQTDGHDNEEKTPDVRLEWARSP